MKEMESLEYNTSELEGKESHYESEEITILDSERLPVNCNSENIPVTEYMDRICEVANTICNAVTNWKEIDMQMQSMDLQFKAFSKQMDVNLEMYRQRAPIVGRQLDSLSVMMNKILDKVLMMDAETEVEINNKMRLMDSVDTYVERITTMMTKLL